VSLATGGTNANLTDSNCGIFYSTASAGAILPGTGTASLPLLSGATAAPTWAAISYPTSATSGGIPYFSSATAISSSAALGANCIVYGGGAGTAPATSTSACPTVSSAGILAVANTTDATSTTSAALTNAGGLGISKSFYMGGLTFSLSSSSPYAPSAAPCSSACGVISINGTNGAAIAFGVNGTFNGLLQTDASGAGFYFVSYNSKPFAIYNSSTTIGGSSTLALAAQGGQVAIGGTAPISTDALLVQGVDATSSNYALVVRNSATTNLLYVRNDGFIAMPSLPNAAGNNILCYNTVNGDVTYEPAVASCVPSAIRYKDLYDNRPLNLEGLMSLRVDTPWSYKLGTSTYENGKKHVGLLADDVSALDERCAVMKDGQLENYEDRCMIDYLTAAYQKINRDFQNMNKVFEDYRRDHP
jgi:hypothetical protein